MDKQNIITLCEQILMAADNIVSVSAMATAANAPQLALIQRTARRIAAEVSKPEAAQTPTGEE